MKNVNKKLTYARTNGQTEGRRTGRSDLTTPLKVRRANEKECYIRNIIEQGHCTLTDKHLLHLITHAIFMLIPHIRKTSLMFTLS